MKLIEGWQKFYKFWSVQLGAVGAAITGVLITNPGVASDIWNMLPVEVKSAIPPSYLPLIGVAISVVGIAAKFVIQRKLTEEVKRDAKANDTNA